MRHYLTLTFILAFVGSSCMLGSRNESNIEIEGIISDSITGKPIQKARVTILCWKRIPWDENYEKVDTVADSKGYFKVKFKKGYKAEIGSIAQNYHPMVIELNDLSSPAKAEVRLTPDKSQGKLDNLGNMAVFARDFNVNSPSKREFFGINILDGINAQSVDSIDIGIQHYDGKDYPKVLLSSARGGLVPIFKNDKIDQAPKSGYVNKYQLTGKEKGIFVKCRNGVTYARLMIFSAEFDGSSPYKNGYKKDYGIVFNVERQLVGREFNSPFDMRLDYYILQRNFSLVPE